MMKASHFLLILAGLSLAACAGQQSETNGNADGMPAQQTHHETPASHQRHIVFFGNSLTAAYGLDPSQGYVALLQQRLDSLGLNWRAINAGLSGETSAGGKARIDWVLRQRVDVFVLELGGNDALRGISPEVTFANLDTILIKVKERYPEARLIVAGMEAPPNMGPSYVKQFREIYPRLAQKHGAALIPFFLERVGGVPELNLPDRIHPNEAGQKILLENVWRVLYPILEET